MIILLQVEPQPDGSKPISQTPGQGSPRLASLYAILGLPLALLGAALLLVPGLVCGSYPLPLGLDYSTP
jgi:hypothetical protein